MSEMRTLAHQDLSQNMGAYYPVIFFKFVFPGVDYHAVRNIQLLYLNNCF